MNLFVSWYFTVW